MHVLYQNEQFDLANEYNTTTSRFIPTKDGVYNIIGSVHFQPTIQNIPYQITVSISVNSVSIGPDKESHGAVNVVGITRDNIVETVDILRLNAGDIVEIVATPSLAGQFLAVNGTRFAASRIPSPSN
ncbi:ABC transporter permease (plasmid) [Bacillus cereus]|nr:ABC transporter permease [Bacillus cereus]QKH11036.1 ABC transporter permease [Bacillus cereus]